MSKEICQNIIQCTGCTACASICPKNCIEMKANNEGFLYPFINEIECVNCRLCERVCPLNHVPPISKQKINTYVARTKDSNLLSLCTSGGVFTTLSKAFITNGGIVYGVVYGENFEVVHQRIDNLKYLNILAGSKYVQSNIVGVFKAIKNDLQNEKSVLVCGTPCQIAGLVNYIGEKREKLYCVDLVCHGVPSPLLWKKYVDYLQQNNGKLIYSNFRSKRLGYHISVMEEHFENGKIQIGSARTNLMTKCFFRNVADRYSCYECQFKTIERCSDITIYDSWHAGELADKLSDDDQGYTNIIIQNNHGNELIENYGKELICIRTDTLMAIQKDGSMAIKSVALPKERENFYLILNQDGMEAAVKKILPISKKDHIVEKIKNLLFEVGVLQYIKRLKS